MITQNSLKEERRIFKFRKTKEKHQREICVKEWAEADDVHLIGPVFSPQTSHGQNYTYCFQ